MRRATGGAAGAALKLNQQGSAATFQVAFYRSKKSRSKDDARAEASGKSPRDKARKPTPPPQQQRHHQHKQQKAFFEEQEELATEPPRNLEKEWESMRARTMIVPPPILPAATKREIQNKMRMRRLGLLNDDEENEESGYDYEAAKKQRSESMGFRNHQQPPLHLRKNDLGDNDGEFEDTHRQPGRRAVSERMKQFTNMQSAPDDVVEREFLIPDEPENAKALDIAVIGRPNAGKSSIMNRLLNVTVSAVSAKYNTTRDRVLGILTEKDRQITFYDTPGIIKPKYVVEILTDSLYDRFSFCHLTATERATSTCGHW